MAGYDDLPSARSAVGGYDDLPAVRPAVGSYDDLPVVKPAASRGVTPWRAPENARQPEPVATPAAAPTPEPTLDTFMAPPTAALKRSLRAPALEQRAAKAKEEEAGKISFDQLYKDPNNLKVINDFVATRFGKDEMQKPGESSEDFVKRFASQMRFLDAGNEITYTKELQWLNSASNEDKLKAGAAYTLWENTASPFNTAGKKGQLGVAPVLDYLAAILTSPSTIASVGVGAAIKSTLGKSVAEQGLKQAVKSNVGKVLAIPATEFIGGAAQSTMAQKKDLIIADAQVKQMEKIFPSLSPEDQAIMQPQIDELKKKVQEGVSVGEAALTGGLGAVMGTAETVGLLKAAKALKGKPTGQLSDILATRRSAMDPTIPTVEVKPGATKLAGEAQLEDAYDIFEGRKLLNKEGDPSAVAEMQIRNDINQKATILAKHIWEIQPEFAPQAGQKVSDAVKNVFQNIDVVDDIALKDAFAKADITSEEFARMNRTTVGDAGRTLQAYSVLARIQNKLKNIDSAAAKQVDAMYGRDNMLTNSFQWFHDSVKSLDKNLKALMVTQIATTMRNIYGTMAVTGFQAASEALESTLYRTGKSLYELGTGKPLTGTFTGGLKGVYDDAFRTAFYLQEQGLTGELTDQLLAGSPTLKSLIVKTAGDAGDEGLWKGARIANTFNAVSDSFVRKAYFTASVEKQLSRAGLDMYDILSQNKNIPLDVLKNATDEALKATMSYMPKTGRGAVENIMGQGVKFVEALGPVGSTVLPFPRFMANAMAWTANHSPVGAFAGAADGLLAKNEAQRIAALNQFSKGMVGTSAIYAAYKYRKENQDKEWYDVDTGGGSLVDTRAIFPLSPFLAMGDYIVKMENNRTDEFKTSDFVAAMTGFKLPAGTTNWLGDKFAESVANLKGTATGEDVGQDKVARFFGEWAGQYLGRAMIPLSQFSDLFGAIDRNETLPRSVYATEPAATPAGEFAQAAALQLKSKTPILKQELPLAVSATRTETPFNDAGLVKMFTGINFKVNPTEFEKEITRLDIQPTKIYSSTGDKVVDAQAKQMLAPVLVDSYNALSSTDFYKNASQDIQKISFNNMLSTLQTEFKNVAIDMSRAEAMNKGKSAIIIENRYAAMAPEVKREAAKLYTANTGKKLEETKDYETGLAYAAAISGILKASPTKPKFAEGGLARKVLGEALSTSITKVGGNILQQMEEMLAKNRAAKMAAPIEAAAVKPAIPAPVKKAAVAAEPMPTPKAAAAEPAMPVPATPEAIPTELPKVSMAETPVESAAFSPDQYAKGEKVLMAKEYQTAQKLGHEMDDDIAKQNLADWASSDPEGYAKALHDSTAKALKLQPDEIPAFVYKADTTAAKAPWEEEYKAYKQAEAAGEDVGDFNPETPTSWKTKGNDMEDMFATNEQITNEPASSLGEPKVPFNEVAFGPVGGTGASVSERNAILQKIRTIRERSFDQLINNKDISALPDAEQVIGVVQGDYRAKTGKEINPKNAADVAEFTDMAKKYQNKLDELRIKYKDEPPVKLFHGTRHATNIGETGFENPLTYHKYHSELRIGAPSFTRDLNLGYETKDFGGRHPEQYLYTEIPYADFVFQRVNMKPTQYDTQDMNTLARAVNGSPTTIRSLGLPRSGMHETEDAIIEADKLVPADKAVGNQPILASAKDIVEPIQAKIKERVEGKITLSKDIIDLYNNILNEQNPSKTKAMANQMYGRVKTLMNTALDTAEATSTKTGLGQRYQKFLENLAFNIEYRKPVEGFPDTFEQPITINTIEMLNVVSDILRNAGSTQKANVLDTLSKRLSSLGVNEFGSVMANTRGQKEAVNAIRELTPKFSKGGLGVRTHMRGMHLKW